MSCLHFEVGCIQYQSIEPITQLLFQKSRHCKNQLASLTVAPTNQRHFVALIKIRVELLDLHYEVEPISKEVFLALNESSNAFTSTEAHTIESTNFIAAIDVKLS